MPATRMFVAPPYRVEISLNALILVLLAAFVVLYLLVRFSFRIARLPQEVSEARRRSNVERARGKQDAAVVALLEGRYGKARQFADEALAIPGSPGLAALVSARAAIDTRDFDAAEGCLQRAEAGAGSLAVPRLMLLAETALERGQPGEALARLGDLKREAGLHTAALRLELRALTAAGRPAEIPPLVDQLVKRKVYDAAQGELVRAGAHAEALAALRQDAAGLRAYWNRLSDADRQNTRVARAGASSFLVLGGDREAAEIIARSLERTWDSELDDALRSVPDARTDAATGDRRAMAAAAQPGCHAALRFGQDVRARVTVGKGPDLPRGERGARQPLARTCGAG